MAKEATKKEETQEVARTEPRTLAPVPAAAEAPQQVLASDITIPRILLMQGLSDFVTERQKTPEGQPIQQGDIVRNTSLEKLADPDSSLDIIPLKMTSDWEDREQVGQKFEFRTRYPRTASNEDLPWEFSKQGVNWRRVKVLNVFALVVKDIENFQAEMKKMAETGEMPDMNKALLPVVISFKSTSFNAGKAVATYFAKVQDMLRYSPNVKSYGYSLELKCRQEKNEKGTFYVFEVGKTKRLADALLAEAEGWYKRLNQMRDIRIDDTGDEEAVEDKAIC